MGKIVILAEKPSVAKSIAGVIGCKTVGNGCLKNERYIVTWALGHLVTLKEPDEIDEKYKKWEMEALPLQVDEIPLKIIPSSKDQYKIVKELITSDDTDSLICATDAGREGELIFRLIYIMANCKKPFRRLWISSMTDESIRNGMNSLQPGKNYDALYRSAKCRAEADWIVGMNASRAYSLRYNARISVGRVQTPTLAFLVRRKKEIDEFKPAPFYVVTADFGKYQGVMFSEKLDPDTHITVKEQAEKVMAIIKGRQGTVVEATTQQKKDAPPLLYDLTTLQRDANKYYGFTAEKTLKLAQSLYEVHKVLTYPRTDSKYLTADIVPILPDVIEKLPEEYEPYKEQPYDRIQDAVFTGTEEKMRVVDESKVSDHHAIIPTNQVPDISKMNAEEQKLYDLVARRLLAAFYPPHEYLATKVITQVDRFKFRTTGKTVTANGWRDVPPIKSGKQEEPGDKEEEKELPPLSEGETYTVKDALMKEDMTQPPLLYTDASLLLAMETAGKDSEDEDIIRQMKGHGIGTPATRAEIIERIITVGYAKRDKKHIIPTEKGVALIGIMPQEITSAEMTGRWEMALDKIADGKQDPQAFRGSIDRFTAFLVNDAKTSTHEIDENAFAGDRQKHIAVSQILEGMECPVCHKGTVREVPGDEAKAGSFFCSEWNGKPKCNFRLWKDAFTKCGGPMLTKEMLQAILEKENCKTNDGFLVTNEDNTEIRYFESGAEKPKATVPFAYERSEDKSGGDGPLSKTKCPICHKGFVKESDRAFGCTRWRDGCKMTLWKNCFERIDGPMMTAELVAQLFKKKTIAISGATIKLEKGRLLYFKPGSDPEGRNDGITYLTPKKV